MMGFPRPLLLAVLLSAPLTTRAGAQAPNPIPAAPSTTAPPPSGPIPQVVPTPPTQRPGPGSPGGTPDAEEGPGGPIPTPPPAGPGTHTVTVAPCATAPAIDGRLTDPCWATATHARGFYRIGGTSPVQEQTEAWVCADAAHLYVAFRCLDSRPELIHAAETQRNGNGTFKDDFVNIDIDSQGTRHGLSSFFVTPRGTQNSFIDGGTADNISWAGDWKAAARRTQGGWTCEVSIPFALLRYPRGAKSFNMALFRKMARETTDTVWPALPPEAAANQFQAEALYLPVFTGIAPSFYAPRPTFLPYTLATGGAGNSAREGLDIKYPLSTTLTGVATLFPDFQTIEQDVTTINFSYNEKLLTDRRPFFAEGRGFLPNQDLFYSRRVGAVDGGLKVAGKEGNTTVGVLTTGTRGVDAQTAAVVNLQQDIGLYSHVLLDAVDDLQRGQASNQAGKIEGVYGWKAGRTQYALQADHLPSWEGGRRRGGKDFYQFSNAPADGHPVYSVNYEDTAPDFVSRLGFNPELDRRGTEVNVSQNNQFDRGRLESYGVGSSLSTYQHHTGGFFHNDVSLYANALLRTGAYCELDYDNSRRDQFNSDTGTVDRFHDHTLTPGFGWNQKSLYQQGSVSDAVGRVAGQRYNFLSASQGLLIARPFSVQLNYSRLAQGGTHSTQAIVTGTYRLNDSRTVGVRLVSQAGADQGGGLGTNLYFSFSQQVRAGTDVFVLFGDPNSPTTRGKFTVKVVRPF